MSNQITVRILDLTGDDRVRHKLTLCSHRNGRQVDVEVESCQSLPDDLEDSQVFLCRPDANLIQEIREKQPMSKIFLICPDCSNRDEIVGLRKALVLDIDGLIDIEDCDLKYLVDAAEHACSTRKRLTALYEKADMLSRMSFV